MFGLTQTGMSVLLDAALKGTVVLAVAGVLTFALRRSSAANRHLVWQLALLAVLSLPLIKAVSPLQLPVVPQLRSPIAADAGSSSFVSDGAEASNLEVTPPAEQSVVTELESLTTAAPTTSPATTPQAATPLWVRLLSWLAIAWLGIATLLLLRLALGFVLVRWFALRAYPLYEDRWATLNQELSSEIGLKQPVQLLASPHVATPMTWGVARPVVMLPAAAEDWSDERRRLVLLHELAHVRRWDSLAHMLAEIACALYWFHPLVWKAAARMRAEAERACDDLVLRAGTRASVYADHLLQLIRTIGAMRTPAVALPMAQRSTFEGRLLAILEPHLDRRSPRPFAVAGMVLVIGVIVLPLAGLTSSNAADAHVMGAGLDAIDARSANDDARAKDRAGAWPKAERALENKLDRRADDYSASASASASAGVQGMAVTALASTLGDRNVEVRLAAAQALGEMEDSLAVAALAQALRTDSDARVRRMAAWALGNIESSQAVPALTHAVRNDRDVEVRRTAVWALGQIEDGSAVPALAEAMRDQDVEVRAQAVWALGQIKDASAVPALSQALRDSNVATRKQAAWALGQIEDASAVPALATALRDADAEVREQAVWALGQIEADQAVAPLTGMLDDPNADVRRQVIWALGQIESASAVTPLSVVLREDRDATVRRTAAWALGQIESEAAVNALAAALRDPSVEVRSQSAWALGQIEPDQAPQALMDALKDANATVRKMAAWALAQIEDARAAPALRGAMRDQDAEVRRNVLRALMTIGDQAGYEALAEMLKDPDPEVRRAAAAALGGRGGSWPEPQPQPQPRPQPRPRPIN